MYSEPLRILYTNYKGVTSIRNIVPQEIYYGSNEWHKEEQWLLDATDTDKGALRTFAVKDIAFIFGENDEEKFKVITKNLGLNKE